MNTVTSATTTPFLSAWERGKASEILFQSTGTRGLATSPLDTAAAVTAVRRTSSGSVSSSSRE